MDIGGMEDIANRFRSVPSNLRCRAEAIGAVVVTSRERDT